MISDKIIVAIDTNEKENLLYLFKSLSGTASYIKIGMESYYSFGSSIIKEAKDRGFKVFLDLKMHDIPNTVAKSCKALAKLDVDMINIHAAGGKLMMSQAVESYREVKSTGDIIAVTHLTSTSKDVLNNEIGINATMNDAILNYAKLSQMSGLSGVVCSAHEVEMIKSNLGDHFKCITPGIRPKTTDHDDQVRIMTPKEAYDKGSDYLVIGRPITMSKDPKQTFKMILEEIM